MPNEKVKYFKPIEEINDKFVYIKDKDLLGFDSANSNAFQFSLWKMAQFNLSENFILMDDDYFIGKPINKSQFFYYNDEQKKVLPCIVSEKFKLIQKKKIFMEYDNLVKKRDELDPHTANGWFFRTISMVGGAQLPEEAARTFFLH